jgi:hypothetical protein
MNSLLAAIVGRVKKSLGEVPLKDKTPPVIAELLVFYKCEQDAIPGHTGIVRQCGVDRRITGVLTRVADKNISDYSGLRRDCGAHCCKD